MAKVALTEQYLEDIADAIRAKNETSNTYTPPEMAPAILALPAGGGIIPTGTLSITTNGTHNVYNYASADVQVSSTINNQNKTVNPSTSQQSITADSGYTGLGTVTVNAMPTMTLPQFMSDTSSGTFINGLQGTTTVKYLNIPIGYNATERYYQISAAAGSAGTPIATKGTVSNHSISVTPSVTNTTGYITGSTKTGTAVTVTASELASGTKSITQNGTGIDVVGYAAVDVSVSGGGGSGLTVDTATATLSSANASISFTGLAGEPTSFAITSAADLATGASPWKTAAVVFDGTSLHGQTIRNTSNAQVTYDGSSFSKTYSNGTLTVTGSGTNFQANQYKLVYTYGGSDIGIANTQVGSGATSVTFTGLEDEPSYFSCIFKSNFSTSSGYQRVITVVYDGTSTYGLEMDSSAKASTAHWSHTYNSGSLTITSQGTNAGGYFHQPGNYQLTYATEGGGGTINLQDKTNINPTTSSQTIIADAGYDGLSSVQINAMPSGTTGTPTASKGTVSNHSISVTPSVTNTTGYITGGTKTGTAVTVSASELVSGSETKTSNGTYDVTNLAELVVSVSGGTINNQNKTVTSSGTLQTVTYDSGYTGLGTVTINAAPSASVSSSFTGQFITENNIRKWRVTPSAYAENSGWVSEGSIPSATPTVYWAVASNTTITPTESAQTVGGSNYMMEGAVTVGAIDSEYVGSLVPRVTSSDVTVSGATVTMPSGFYSTELTKTVASGSATGPSSLSGTSATVSTGTNTLTLTKTGVTTTPTVSAGYVSSATASTATVTLTASVTTKAAATITPGTTNQTIASGTYLTGTQTIAGDADLVGGNILSTANIFGVQGTVVVQNYYTGSSAPSSSTGSNGDLYLQS